MRTDAKDPRPRRAPSASREAGETLLECIIAMALAVMIFVPCSVLFRQALGMNTRLGGQLRAACAVRPMARTLATQLWLGEPVEPFSYTQLPVPVESRVEPAFEEEADAAEEPAAARKPLLAERVSAGNPASSRTLFVVREGPDAPARPGGGTSE